MKYKEISIEKKRENDYHNFFIIISIILKNKDYVIVDIETTGLSKERHHITEIAAVQFDGKKIVNKFQTLINPQTPIPAFITKFTGITNNMVKNAPTIDQVLPSFIDFLGDHIFVAHNATFDYGFLNYNGIKHVDTPIHNFTLCTRRLANRLVPELPSKRLECLCQHFWITNQRAHRAMGDVMATVEVLQHFLKIMENQDIQWQESVMEFQFRSAKYIR